MIIQIVSTNRSRYTTIKEANILDHDNCISYPITIINNRYDPSNGITVESELSDTSIIFDSVSDIDSSEVLELLR